MKNTKRMVTATVVGAGALLGILATPANAASGPLPVVGDVLSPQNWNWSSSAGSQSNMQSQNGLVNLATGGNLCTGVLAMLAPTNSCPAP